MQPTASTDHSEVLLCTLHPSSGAWTNSKPSLIKTPPLLSKCCINGLWRYPVMRRKNFIVWRVLVMTTVWRWLYVHCEKLVQSFVLCFVLCGSCLHVVVLCEWLHVHTETFVPSYNFCGSWRHLVSEAWPSLLFSLKLLCLAFGIVLVNVSTCPFSSLNWSSLFCTVSSTCTVSFVYVSASVKANRVIKDARHTWTAYGLRAHLGSLLFLHAEPFVGILRIFTSDKLASCSWSSNSVSQLFEPLLTIY